jgi:hypothetical protein
MRGILALSKKRNTTAVVGSPSPEYLLLANATGRDVFLHENLVGDAISAVEGDPGLSRPVGGRPRRS